MSLICVQKSLYSVLISLMNAFWCTTVELIGTVRTVLFPIADQLLGNDLREATPKYLIIGIDATTARSHRYIVNSYGFPSWGKRADICYL